MGGIVAKPVSNDVTSSIRQSFEASSKHKLSDYPLLTFDEVQALLPDCASSWNHVAQTRVNGRLLVDYFQIQVLEGLRDLKDQGDKIIEMLLKDSNKKRAKNPIAFVMRYIVKTRRSDDHQFKKKLMLLGREHSRYGISETMIVKFCEVLLCAFAACLEDNTSLYPIMHAWTANFRYVIALMTNLRFSFALDTISGDNDTHQKGTQRCCLCGGSSGGGDLSAEGLCDECSAPSHTLESCDSKESISFIFDGLSHDCHSIPEGSSAKEISVLYDAEKYYDQLLFGKTSADAAVAAGAAAAGASSATSSYSAVANASVDAIGNNANSGEVEYKSC